MEYCQNIDEPKTTEGQTDFFTNVLPNGASNTKKKFAAQLAGGRSEIGPRPFLTDVPYLKIWKWLIYAYIVMLGT